MSYRDTTFEQLKDSAEALIRGDRDAWDVFTKGVQTAQELQP